jgi:hypothetical protein
MKRAMALATRVESCDKESDGFGSKSDGDEGGRRLTAIRAMATVMVMMWVTAMVTRLAGDKEGKGEGGKGDGNGDEGGGRRRGNGDGGKSGGNGDNGGRRGMVMAMVAKRVMVMATRVGEVGGRRNGQCRWPQERWRQQQGWRASNSIQWQGWQAIDGDNGDGGSDSDDVGDGDGDEAGGRRRGQG